MRTDEPPENACEGLHIRKIQEAHKAGKVPRRNGAGRSLEGALCPHRTLLPQGGKRPSSGRSGADAPNPFPSEKDLRFFEGQVQGTGQEHQLRLCALCPVEPVPS